MDSRVPDHASPFPDNDRFVVPPRFVRRDRLMRRIIQVGGALVVVVVLLMLVFVVGEVWPLVRGATVTPARTVAVDLAANTVALGVDDHAELPFLLDAAGRFTFVDLAGDRGEFRLSSGIPADFDVTALAYIPRDREVVLGGANGRVAVVTVSYSTAFDETGVRTTNANLRASGPFSLGVNGSPVTLVAHGNAGRSRLIAATQTVDGRPRLFASRIRQDRTLLGVGELVPEEPIDLTHLIDGSPVHVLVPWESDAIIVANEAGEVFYLFDDPNSGFLLRQTFTPFADATDRRIVGMQFLLADVSVVVANAHGEVRTFSLYRDPDAGVRLWDHFRTFPSMQRAPGYILQSPRNKAFLIGDGDFAAVRYNTTADTRWEGSLPFNADVAAFGARYDGLLFLDAENRLHWWELDDPHPAAGWRTYFGRVRYEGLARADHVWQSSGATDDFEPKLSMIPLIVGTLKGTFYAMLFALPIALLAAIYTSQFARSEVRDLVKPTMEIMASLPSVVLGFVAALWLAPIISNAVPSVVASVVFVVSTAVLVGLAFEKGPPALRRSLRPGIEFVHFFPAMLVMGVIGWKVGAILERVIFVVTDPVTGFEVADFRLWYALTVGSDFEQRNALVVGFVMGFAVIPVIFTIAEDSLSTVPEALRSGSLALGASRWQTAVRVVLPTAAAGIFSAVMIGLGRAVGETMIVVMATGNVPVMDLNLFTGMRTLAANIAVELPEAPWRSTLYRSLFLGALLLFSFTFVANTVAEVLRQHLRDRYRAVE